MQFIDRVLVKLADPAARSAVFDSEALEQIASAAYDTSRATIEGPFRAVFDEVRLGIAVQRNGSAEGYFGPLNVSDRSGANFTISGLGGSAFLVNALWKGYVVATATAPSSHIESVAAGHIDLAAIDAAIAAGPGGVPVDRAALAAERRARFLTALAAAAADDDTVTPALVDRELARAGAADMNGYFERFSRTTAYVPVQIQFTAPVAPPAAPKSLPISAALVVREATADLTQLLADCRMVREQLIAAGEGRADDSEIPQRHSLIAVWMVPSAVFNDNDWPGANPAARRKAAGEWLAREGVGLAVMN